MMCKKMKSAILLLLILTLSAMLIACSSDKDKESDEDSNVNVSFETEDLDGNPVNSEELFSQKKLTMVNIWGTFCGPCIQEMPDLEILNGKLAAKDCQLIGIVCDVSGKQDQEHIRDAKDIIKQTGVTYTSLIPWNEWNQAFPSQYIPSTYFVDSQGNVIGEALVGARSAEEYEALVDETLKNVE